MKFTWSPFPLVLCIGAVVPMASPVNSAAQAPTGQGSTLISKQDRLAPARLPRMYEHAFRVQNNMEKQAAAQESRGGSGSAFREMLRSRFGLTEEQFALFQKAALRFDPVDQEIRTRLHSVAQADTARHARTRVLSAEAMAQIDNLRTVRGWAAKEEVETIHRSLDPGTAQQLDDAVARLFSDARGSIASRESRVALTTNALAKNAQTMPQTARPALLGDCGPGGKFCEDDDDDGGDDDVDDGGSGGCGRCGGGPPPTDPTPVITGITPGIWYAGKTQPVTITGEYFGTNAPILSLSPSAGITYTLVSYSSGQIVANVTVAPNVATEGVEVSVTCTGYGGLGFYGGSNGNSPTSNPDGVTIEAFTPPAPVIKWNGSTISGTTQSAVVGQQISLTTQVTLPAGVSISSNAWTVGGTNIGDFAGSAAGASVTNTTLSVANTSFYWVFAGSGLSVRYAYCISGIATCPSASVAFNVTGPTGGTMSVMAYNHVNIASLGACVLNGQSIPAGPWLAYGGSLTGPCSAPTGLPGVTFNAPTGYSNASDGSFSLVQVINDNIVSGSGPGGDYNINWANLLDGSFPYSGLSDAPMTELLPAYTNVSRTFTATTFLMWQPPPPSIPVPLGYQQWGFSASATCSTSCTSATNWTVTQNGTPGLVGSFTSSTPDQPSVGNIPLQYGYPLWSGDSDDQ